MSIKKRLRIVWAALSQNWHMNTCQHCKTTQWVEGLEMWSDSVECLACELKAYEAWEARYKARLELQSRINRGVA